VSGDGHAAARESLDALRGWVEAEGWVGWDPFDVRAHPFYQRLSARARSERWVDRAFLNVAYRAEQRFPLAVRRLGRIRPEINAMGMGYFANGYIQLGEHGDERAAAEGDARLAWLLEHPSPSTRALGWGYPFDWQSSVFIPAGTPSSVVTCSVADALRSRHYVRAEEGDDARFHAIGRFIVEDLRMLDGGADTGCFSYTPLDTSRVHNASMMAAEYLVWAGGHLGEAAWLELGHRALRYTADDQEPSGAWDYWGPPDRGRRHVDPYHTGFVIRMLLRAYESTGVALYREREIAGYAYFVKHLFTDGRPVATEDRAYPINIFSVAEGLLTFVAAAEHDPDADRRIESLVTWARAEMQNPDGYFYYLWSPNHVNRLPMMRWSQATMFLALAAVVTHGA
jgi:hypothetical protein